MTIKIHIQTPDGSALIGSNERWNRIGPYSVVGPGKNAATEWLQNEAGAYGVTIGEYAAPADLHVAALWQQQNPCGDVQVVAIECEPAEYDNGLSDNQIP